MNIRILFRLYLSTSEIPENLGRKFRLPPPPQRDFRWSPIFTFHRLARFVCLMALPSNISEADKLLLAHIEQKLKLHWDTPIDHMHPLVNEYHACTAVNDYTQCRDDLLQLHQDKDDLTKWKFAIRGTRFLELEKANRAERKKAGKTVADIKAEFPTLNLPFTLSTLYNRIKPWAHALDKRLALLQIVTAECTFRFVDTYSTQIRDIVDRLSHARVARVVDDARPSPDQDLIPFINNVPIAERGLRTHQPQLKQLKSRVLVPFPRLHNASLPPIAPIVGIGVSLPCLMECDMKTPMGTVSVVAVLAYVDVEHAVPSTESSTSASWYDTRRGEVWYRRDPGQQETTTFHRSLMLHSIQSIRPFQVSIPRRLLNAKFSSLRGIFDALEAKLPNDVQPGDLWHLSARPHLTLAEVMRHYGFVNHPLSISPVTFPGWSTSLTFRDAFCWLCWMECDEWQCEPGQLCTHNFATVPKSKPVPCHEQVMDGACNVQIIVGSFRLDSRIWCKQATVADMLDFDRRVFDDEDFPSPLVEHWNILMDAGFPLEWRDSGIHWNAYNAGHTHADMIQSDLDVQTLCCYLPADHLHVCMELENGNTIFYWLGRCCRQHSVSSAKGMAWSPTLSGMRVSIYLRSRHR